MVIFLNWFNYMTDKIIHQVRLFLILGILKNTYVIYTNSDLPNFPFTSIPLPATTQNGRVAGLVVSPFRFSKISPKYLTSNPLPQIVASNPRLQPDTDFAIDMFPYKITELCQKYGFKSKPPKKPGNTPLSGTYLSFLDIKTTVSTCGIIISDLNIPRPRINTCFLHPLLFCHV